ncbi:leucine-rich repeat-containing protein 74A-like [Saccostrea echinata]|uniref:leucine-rich repeat-containing protein 74A-like n=1 Tax=Saccostrea echinata TaxID=191078 RepID=UPI002A80E010|nr:leucine-rich repeat-containing protein 74A-like [Saccostrea echinata]
MRLTSVVQDLTPLEMAASKRRRKSTFKALVHIRWQLVRDYVRSGRFRELYRDPGYEEMDRGGDADYIVFRMGEREKTFFEKLGMDTGQKKMSFREVAEKLMEQKLSSSGYEDPNEMMFLEQYKKRKEERRIAEEKAKAEKKTKTANEQQQLNAASGTQLETVVEEGVPSLDLNSNELNFPNDSSTTDIRKSSVMFNDTLSTTRNGSIFNGSYISTERRHSAMTDTDRSVITDVLNDDVTRDLFNSCPSRKSTASLRMRPKMLDAMNGFDFDEGEDIALSDLKSYKKPIRIITKTRDMYNIACAMCGVVPLRQFVKQCHGRYVNLNSVMMSAKTIKPIAISLVRDRRVVDLDVSENNIGPLGTMYISEMMTRNDNIVELNLSCTYPGKEGLRVLSESLTQNKSLEILRLESNKIQHTETHLINSLIENVRNLKELYLGHNAIGYEGGCALAKCLEDNTTLRILDLQWNHIRRESASALCKCLSENVGLRTLDISWNGLGKEGCIALATSLPKNVYLKSLIITSNRIDMLSLRFLLHGLVRNKALISLEMGRNPITTEGAKAVIRAVLSSKVSSLERICLDDISVDEQFMVFMKELYDKKGVRVTHGELLSNGNVVEEKHHDPHDLNRFDPVMVLVEYMRIDNLRLIDFFQYLDTNSREKLSKSDFREGAANLCLPLTEHHLDLVMEKVDLKKDGYVDLEEFMTVHREVSRQITQRTTKAKSKKKEDEGLVSLRKILKEIVEKRNKSHKEKARDKIQMKNSGGQLTQLGAARRLSETTNSLKPTNQRRRNSIQISTSPRSVISNHDNGETNSHILEQ